jgi:hypothetical protein
MKNVAKMAVEVKLYSFIEQTLAKPKVLSI